MARDGSARDGSEPRARSVPLWELQEVGFTEAAQVLVVTLGMTAGVIVALSAMDDVYSSLVSLALGATLVASLGGGTLLVFEAGRAMAVRSERRRE